MEAQTDVTTYLEQGKQALAQGQGREAAIAYAHAAQLEPENPLVHLGLAEANLALGSYGIVHMACRRTQELVQLGPAYSLAQALLDLLDRRYDQALQQVDAAIKDDPGNAYAHALRAYLLRATNQSYDAGLARSRASRLSFGGKFENCFPELAPTSIGGYTGQPLTPPPPATPAGSTQTAPQQQEWARPDLARQRMIRTRFWFSQHPRFLTFLLIGLNVFAYCIIALLSQNFVSINVDVLVNMGGQVNLLVTQGQFWRLLTAMFLHASIIHIVFNMFSLFFIGSIVEIFYGKWRYLLIYLLSGIIGGLVAYFMVGAGDINVSIGASGAIAGIFGALGAFFLVNRRALGPIANSMIGQWAFWLLLNVAFNFSDATNIGWQDHLGGLIAGLFLGVLLLPPLRRSRRRV